MLLGNYSVLNRNPGRNIGGGASGLGMYRADFNKTSPMRNNFFKSEVATQPSLKSGFPNGYLSPYSWSLPQKSGGLASYTNINGDTIVDFSIAGGLNSVSSISGSGSLSDVNLIMIFWLISSLTGTTTSNIEMSGTIPALSNISGTSDISANIYSLISIVSSLYGEGFVFGDVLSVISAISFLDGNGFIENSDLVSSILALANISSSAQLNSDIVGILNGFSNIEGQSTITSSIKAIASVIGQIISSGVISDATLPATGSLSAEVTPFTDLSPQSLAGAVWNSIATAYNTSGTMGYKLNNVSVGSGGSLSQEEHDKLMSIVDDFGDEVLENGITVYDALRIILSVLAGKSSVSENVVSFRDVLDNKTRVTATVGNDGERISVSIDGS